MRSKPGSSKASVQAIFQPMRVRNDLMASRPERPSRAWSTTTEQRASTGIEGPPLPKGNRSAKSSSLNSS